MSKKPMAATVRDGDAAPPRRRGNPTPAARKTPQGMIALDSILADITAGEPAYKAVKAHGITMGTFWRWLAHDAELMEKYMRAKKVGLDRYAEDLLQITDDQTIPPEHKRIMVDTRKWLLSKLIPKFSEKLAIEHSDGDALLTALCEGRARALANS